MSDAKTGQVYYHDANGRLIGQGTLTRRKGKGLGPRARAIAQASKPRKRRASG